MPTVASCKPPCRLRMKEKCQIMLHYSGFSDGNFAVRLDSNSCARTLGTSGPWWLVDLGQNYQVTQVAITTRNDNFCSVCGNFIRHLVDVQMVQVKIKLYIISHY